MSVIAPQSDLITRAGYQRLCDELDELVTTGRAGLAEWLRDARLEGRDPVENAHLAEALDERALLEGRIAELKDRLARARIVEPASDGAAALGARVSLRIPTGSAVAYELVGALEADGSQRRLSIASPVGEALLGRAAGDVVDVTTPSGPRRFEVLAIDFPEDAAAASASGS